MIMPNKRLLFLTVILVVIALFIAVCLWRDNERGGKDGSLMRPPSSGSQLRIPNKLDAVLTSYEKSVTFYGVVVDENEAPLPYVAISWSIARMGRGPEINGVVESDNMGGFIVNGIGASLRFDLFQKEGYKEAGDQLKTFGYAGSPVPYVPDASKPCRFVMLKKDVPAAVKKELKIAFDWDGMSVDLPIGVAGIKENLVLVPSKGPEVPGVRGFDWSLIVSLKGGQVLLAERDGAPLAPLSGYSDSIEFKDSAGSHWMASADGCVFVKTGSGQFGRIYIKAYADRDMRSSLTARLSISWNATGGRAFK